MSGDAARSGQLPPRTSKPTGSVLEVAVADVEDAIVAQRCGADRLELNSGMPLGGLTPSQGLLRETLAEVAIPVVVMVRPRPGGFCYSARQWRVALHDAEAILAAGAAGVVCGPLDAQRRIDGLRMAELRDLCGPRDLVFHRAFDLLPEWEGPLAQLIDLGVDRLLSSGQQPQALAGLTRLQAMQKWAGTRLAIVAGSGVRAASLAALHASGLRQFHGTFSCPIEDPGYDDAPFRFADNDHLRELDRHELNAAVLELQRLDTSAAGG